MRIEVEICTIEVDALPAGVTVEGLRAAVVQALEARIRAGGVPGLPGSGEGGFARLAVVGSSGLSAEIASGIQEGLAR